MISEISHWKKRFAYFVPPMRRVLVYGCKIWSLRIDRNGTLKVFNCWCLRNILRTNKEEGRLDNELRTLCSNARQLTTDCGGLGTLHCIENGVHLVRKGDTALVITEKVGSLRPRNV